MIKPSTPGAKPWKYALAQHPMWLIIAEDTVCAERTPPWGCPSIEEYAEYLGKSLESLERHSQLRLNFDFSAVELEDLAERRPDLMQRMRKLTQQGRIAFTNGTYSQPHLHILSTESMIRQFEHGIGVIERLAGYRVRCYATQEPGFSQQLPQILRSFGYETATTPDFPFGVRILYGEVQHWALRWHWLDGDEFANWLGIDGTTIPAWLTNSGCWNERALSDDAQRGLLRETRLRVDMPDMVAVDEAWVEERTRSCELVILDETLEEMARKQPPEAVVQFDANYAYTEGVDAEALSRANTRVENALLRLETLMALLPVERKPEFDFDGIWKTVLKAQHHDAYWTGAPELRAKSIGWLAEVESKTSEATEELLRALGKRLPTAPKGTRAVVVAHTYPAWRIAIPEFEIDSEDIEVVDEKGKPRTYQTRRLSDGTLRTAVLARGDGVGYSTFFVRRGSGKVTEARPARGVVKLGDDYRSVRVRADGSVTSLRLDGKRMLASEGNRWVCVRDGEDASPVPVKGSMRVERGPLYEAVESKSELGPIQLTTRVTVGSFSSSVNIETELDFREPTEVGDYFDDRTKLHLAWDVGKDVEITYLSGGCPEFARPGKSFPVYPALDVVGKRGGLAIRFDSAAKCWLDEDGVLRCVMAWGHNGDHFHNRQGPLSGIMGPLAWLKPMDLRLRGKQLIRHAVMPHPGALTDAELINFAFSDAQEPLALPVETGSGKLPWSDASMVVRGENLVLLSMRPTECGAVARLLNASDERIKPNLKLAPGWKAGIPRLLDRPFDKLRVKEEGLRVREVRTVPPWAIVEVPLHGE